MSVRLVVMTVFAILASACGSSSSSSSGSVSDASTDASTDAAVDGAAGDASGNDDCTPRGALYQCQSQPTCDPNYTPATYSCGAPSKYCCIKGALPQDAGAD